MPSAFIAIASKPQARTQSARPRHPQAHPFPPPATAAAAAQVGSPRYSACWRVTCVPPAHSMRATTFTASPASTPR